MICKMQNMIKMQSTTAQSPEWRLETASFLQPTVQIPKTFIKESLNVIVSLKND